MKYKQIKVNIPEEDYLKIKEKAEAAGYKISGYLKTMLIQNNLLTAKKKKIVDKNLLYELNKVGNNINQIARYLNINKELDYNVFEKLEVIEKHLEDIKKVYL